MKKAEFLAHVQRLVEDGSITLLDLVEAATRAQEARYEKLNVLRVEAETAAMFLFDLVPVSRHKKHPVMMNRAKHVLVNTGCFAGSQLCKELEAEIKAKD